MCWGTPGNKALPTCSSSNIPQRWQKFLLWMVLLSDANNHPSSLSPPSTLTMAFWDPLGRSNGLKKFNWTLHTVLVSPWMLFQHYWNHRWETLTVDPITHCMWIRSKERKEPNIYCVLTCARHNATLSHVALPQQTCEIFTVEDYLFVEVAYQN